MVIPLFIFWGAVEFWANPLHALRYWWKLTIVENRNQFRGFSSYLNSHMLVCLFYIPLFNWRWKDSLEPWGTGSVKSSSCCSDEIWLQGLQFIYLIMGLVQKIASSVPGCLCSWMSSMNHCFDANKKRVPECLSPASLKPEIPCFTLSWIIICF